MELIVTLAIYSHFFNTNSFVGFDRNDAYCQNVYWQPHALEEMHIAGCDVTAVEEEIQLVKSGRFE